MEKDNIDKAEAFYKAGDYLQARKLAHEILEQKEADEEDRRRARRILTATGPDPMVAVAFVVTACVIVFLIIRYIL
jgi:cytochrome c-type biogenesis protein CcmH/NrfG